MIAPRRAIASPVGEAPWTQDTMVVVMSTTKGLAAMTLADDPREKPLRDAVYRAIAHLTPLTAPGARPV